MSEQMTLLELEVKAPEPIIWERNGAVGKIGVEYLHRPSGWIVCHCGHPTANYPYYIVTPNGGVHIYAPNGRGFQNLAIAKQFVEEHAR